MTGRAVSARHWPAFILVLLALLLRAGIPDGYMIGTDAAGAARIELCPGKAMVMPMPHGAGHHGQPREMPCPFGVLTAPAMPSLPPVAAVAPMAIVPLALALLLPTLLPPKAAAPPPPSTGPPARR
jgi:hypothetical protein